MKYNCYCVQAFKHIYLNFLLSIYGKVNSQHLQYDATDREYVEQIQLSLRLLYESHLYDPCVLFIVLLSVVCRLYKNKCLNQKVERRQTK